MTDKQKILSYLKSKNLSKNSFYSKTGLSMGFLDSGSSLGVDKLRVVFDNYHDINPLWFFSEKAEMLIDDNKNILINREDVDNNLNLQGGETKFDAYTNRDQNDFTAFIDLIEKTKQAVPEVIEQLRNYAVDFDKELVYRNELLSRERKKFEKYKNIVNEGLS